MHHLPTRVRSMLFAGATVTLVTAGCGDASRTPVAAHGAPRPPAPVATDATEDPSVSATPPARPTTTVGAVGNEPSAGTLALDRCQRFVIPRMDGTSRVVEIYPDGHRVTYDIGAPDPARAADPGVPVEPGPTTITTYPNGQPPISVDREPVEPIDPNAIDNDGCSEEEDS